LRHLLRLGERGLREAVLDPAPTIAPAPDRAVRPPEWTARHAAFDEVIAEIEALRPAGYFDDVRGLLFHFVELRVAGFSSRTIEQVHNRFRLHAHQGDLLSSAIIARQRTARVAGAPRR
jgi:hypothetical protein